VESSPLTACINIPNSSLVILGTLQNEVALYQVDCCRLECVAQVHDDNITSLGVTFLFLPPFRGIPLFIFTFDTMISRYWS